MKTTTYPTTSCLCVASDSLLQAGTRLSRS